MRMATQDNPPAAGLSPEQDALNSARRSALSPESLRAAEQSDGIPVEGKWGPGQTLLAIIGASGGLWGLFFLAKQLLDGR